MKRFHAALITEASKAVRSKMLWMTIIFFVFVSIMMGFLMFVTKHPAVAGNSAVLSAKASMIESASWPIYLSLLMQMCLVLGMLGPGMVTIWIFGREYSDRVIKDLLALPVPRSTIVSSKFVIIIIWSMLLLSLLFVLGILAGFIVGLGGWSREAFISFSKAFAGSSLLTILLCTPIALITVVSRGYLLPVALLILLLIVTQFIFVGFTGITPYFPWAVPALFCGAAGPSAPKPGFISYFILALTCVSGIICTAAWWRFADQK
jgi:ABC-2 type transport system permease protein